MSKKRKAWDAAIQQVAAQTGSKIEVPGKRDGEKRETRRRVNARRWIATSDVDDLRRKMEARLEALEEADHLGENVEEDEEEWVDEEEVRAVVVQARSLSLYLYPSPSSVQHPHQSFSSFPSYGHARTDHGCVRWRHQAEGRGRKAKSKAARNLKKVSSTRVRPTAVRPRVVMPLSLPSVHVQSAGGRSSSGGTGGGGGGKGSASGGGFSMAELTRRYRVRPLAQVIDK